MDSGYEGKTTEGGSGTQENQGDTEPPDGEETWCKDWWSPKIPDNVHTLPQLTESCGNRRPKPPKPYFRPSLPQVVSEVGYEEMEAMVTKVAEGQQKLEKIIERLLTVTTEERESLTKVLSGQEEKLDKVAQSQETSLGKLADLLG
ncbi:hypothetical protein NDU88_001823 [Pleurodeles waltl]|uniref:Uncharacterized protein n=1 Tax=Pleurodeles waltl TaxID=8319 RepID=A0AAV7Q4Z1_PLEWA|nr:hypothetical protein NDU88_001823 [Pleurodeles waltl]